MKRSILATLVCVGLWHIAGVAATSAQVYQGQPTPSAYQPAAPTSQGYYPPRPGYPAVATNAPSDHGVVPVQYDGAAPVAAPAASPPAGKAIISPPGTLEAQPGEHPLAPAVRWAKVGRDEINKYIKDYSCQLVKRERIGSTLGDYEYMFAKVRHDPHSVYVYFLGPASMKGQEAIYVAGQNEGKLLAHPNGIKHRLVGTVALVPTSMLAMAGNKYPITEMGIKRLVDRLIEVGEHDMQYGECEVKILHGAKINDREAMCIQVVHPVPRKEFIFHMARIYIDMETNLPCRYEAYQWPTTPGGPPVLDEEYTFLDLKVNNGFTDLDFDPKNPNYAFE